MKTLKAWAIVEHERLAVLDHRCPVYWRRYIAAEDAKRECIASQVVPVEIRPIRPKRKRRSK